MGKKKENWERGEREGGKLEMLGGNVTKWGEDLFCLCFFFFFFFFFNDWNLSCVNQNGNFLPGKSISRQGKNQEKLLFLVGSNIFPTLYSRWQIHYLSFLWMFAKYYWCLCKFQEEIHNLTHNFSFIKNNKKTEHYIHKKHDKLSPHYKKMKVFGFKDTSSFKICSEIMTRNGIFHFEKLISFPRHQRDSNHHFHIISGS